MGDEKDAELVMVDLGGGGDVDIDIDDEPVIAATVGGVWWWFSQLVSNPNVDRSFKDSRG